MSFPRILPFAALLLACNAMAGFYATAALAAILEALPAYESCADTAALDPASAKTRAALADPSGMPATVRTGCEEQPSKSPQ